ncbi:MAG: chromate transporter [Bacillota bacterium]
MEKQRKPNWRLLGELFLSTLKIGAITFGGGLAMVAVIEREFAGKKKWIAEEEMIDIIAVSQSLPGVIAINSSVMTGYRVAGVWGAVAAAVGVTLPSLLALMVVTLFYQAFRTNPWVNAAFRGLSVGVTALLASVAVRMGRRVLKDVWTVLFFAVALCASLFSGVYAIWIILAGGVLGYAFKRGGIA